MFLSQEALFEEEKDMKGKIVSLLTAIVFAVASLVVPVAASAQTTGSAPTAEKAAPTKKAPKKVHQGQEDEEGPQKGKSKEGPCKEEKHG